MQAEGGAASEYETLERKSKGLIGYPDMKNLAISAYEYHATDPKDTKESDKQELAIGKALLQLNLNPATSSIPTKEQMAANANCIERGHIAHNCQKASIGFEQQSQNRDVVNQRRQENRQALQTTPQAIMPKPSKQIAAVDMQYANEDQNNDQLYEPRGYAQSASGC
ncbi:hypothetical protein V502_05792 [Pseudogymnoascus sp. VKM F-4520 (FW-2644)]|nr:hypothetical protein V502_05792 [Pseudogymnoascus sp. VKM F-4520 (FW-2644)]